MNAQELLAFLSRHPLLALGLAGVTLVLLYTEAARLLQRFRTIKPGELVPLVNRDNALVIDLRAQADFQQGHVSGSRHVQMSQFDPEHKQLAAAKALPVVVVCKTGMTAAGAARRLVKAGFEKVYVLDGGIEAWRGAGLPLVKGRA